MVGQNSVPNVLDGDDRGTVPNKELFAVAFGRDSALVYLVMDGRDPGPNVVLHFMTAILLYMSISKLVS